MFRDRPPQAAHEAHCAEAACGGGTETNPPFRPMPKAVEVVKAARLVRMLPLRCAIAFATARRALSSQQLGTPRERPRCPLSTSLLHRQRGKLASSRTFFRAALISHVTSLL